MLTWACVIGCETIPADPAALDYFPPRLIENWIKKLGLRSRSVLRISSNPSNPYTPPFHLTHPLSTPTLCTSHPYTPFSHHTNHYPSLASVHPFIILFGWRCIETSPLITSHPVQVSNAFRYAFQVKVEESIDYGVGIMTGASSYRALEGVKEGCISELWAFHPRLNTFRQLASIPWPDYVRRRKGDWEIEWKKKKLAQQTWRLSEGAGLTG